MTSPNMAPLRYLTSDYYKRRAKQVVLGNFDRKVCHCYRGYLEIV